MKQFKFIIASIIIIAAGISCKKNLENNEDVAALKAANNGTGTAGYVYTLSNQSDGNNVIAYSRNASGVLTYQGSYPTGGNGTGAGLGSQGAIVLSEDNGVLLAVNAGSNTISSFIVTNGVPTHISTIASGGITPISITMDNERIYALNAGGSGNISGFHLLPDASLAAIPNSTRPLSSDMSGPAQVSFVADGHAVAITEKATNKIITYTIDAAGNPGSMHMITSAHPTPFGFAVGKKGYIYVSEAAGGAVDASAVSSYAVSNDGIITLVDGPATAGQTAACWVVATNNGKYVYATNTGSNTVTSFLTNNSGSLDILSAAAASTGMSSTPIDAALTNNSKIMYVLNSGNHTIAAFNVENNGSLNHIQTVTGLPAGTAGLAAK